MKSSSRSLLLEVSVAVACLILVSCGKEKPAPGGSGFIEAAETTVSVELAGQVRLIWFNEGSPIAKGDTIAEIDTLTTMLRLRQAHAARTAAEKKVRIASITVEQASYNVDLVKKEYDRANALIELGATNQQRVDEVETSYRQAALARKQADAAYEAAQADLSKVGSDVKLLEKQLGDCFPVSPLKGVVTTRFVDAGEWLAVGKPLVKIASLDTVWVKVYLPAVDLMRIRLGGNAKIDPEDGRKQPLDGTITWISDEAEFTPKNVQTKEARADLVYAVKVTIPNPGAALKIGMPVAVTIQ
jgi:HlyD family secretion protein